VITIPGDRDQRSEMIVITDSDVIVISFS